MQVPEQNWWYVSQDLARTCRVLEIKSSFSRVRLQVHIIFSLLCGSSSALEAVPLAEHKDSLDSLCNYDSDTVNGVVVSDHSLGRPKALEKSMDHRPKAMRYSFYWAFGFLDSGNGQNRFSPCTRTMMPSNRMEKESNVGQFLSSIWCCQQA